MCDFECLVRLLRKCSANRRNLAGEALEVGRMKWNTGILYI